MLSPACGFDLPLAFYFFVFSIFPCIVLYVLNSCLNTWTQKSCRVLSFFKFFCLNTRTKVLLEDVQLNMFMVYCVEDRGDQWWNMWILHYNLSIQVEFLHYIRTVLTFCWFGIWIQMSWIIDCSAVKLLIVVLIKISKRCNIDMVISKMTT